MPRPFLAAAFLTIDTIPCLPLLFFSSDILSRTRRLPKPAHYFTFAVPSNDPYLPIPCGVFVLHLCIP